MQRQGSDPDMRTCSCCSGARKVKKGLWSPDEDQKLKDYVSKHGYKAWSQVPIEAGLERCGKSCRLRWLNYLRPDLKRGNFSAEEQQLIFELQAAYGNRWSWIAKWMPGRTDNEIKNFWNVSRSAKNYKAGQVSRFRLAVPFRFDSICEAKLECKAQVSVRVDAQLENACARQTNSRLEIESSMDDLMSDISLSDGTVQEFMSWGDLIQPDLFGSIFQL